jgi:outer membrane protein assembly factor BamE
MFKHTKGFTIFWVLACFGLAGCNSFNQASYKVASLVTPYRPEVVQGNFISREQFALVKLGMTRQEVRTLLGTPLVTSLFHNNRWDYVFTLAQGGNRREFIEEQHVSLFFDGDILAKIQGGSSLVSENEFVSTIDEKVKAQKLKPSPAR